MGFDLTYWASTNKYGPLFGNQQNDITDDSQPELQEKSTVLKNANQQDLWKTLDDGKFKFEKF